MSKSKCQNHLRFSALLEVKMLKKCTWLWREGHFKANMLETQHVRRTFGRSTVMLRGSHHGCYTLRKASKREGFVTLSKTMAGVGRLKRICKDACRGRRSTRDTSIRHARTSEHWFPENGCILEHQILKFAKAILRDRRSSSYDLAALFRGGRNTLERWDGKIATPNGTRLSAVHSTFHFWRKPRRIASFWNCQLSLLKEVLQNCFVLHLSTATFEGCLAELLRFAPVNCYFRRKSRTIASFQIDGQMDCMGR